MLRASVPLMKKFRLFILFFFDLSLAAISTPLWAQSSDLLQPKDFVCDLKNPVRSYRQSRLFQCKPKSAAGAPFFVATLKGSFKEISRAHGYLLGREAENGVIAESLELVEYGISQKPAAIQPLLLSLSQCFGDILFKQLTSEFKDGINGFHQGYAERMKNLKINPRFTAAQIRFASVGIELGNVLDAANHKDNLLSMAMNYCPSQMAAAPFSLIEGLLGGIDSSLKNTSPFKLGCTGFTVPSQDQSGRKLTEDGLIHGRNLDGELMRSWNKAPALFVIHETGFIPYVATGAAGMVYAGGISGFNAEGISVSSHQMYSAQTNFGQDGHSGSITPFLQQRILREAKSIDQAIQIAKKANSIGSWTILIADSKTNESASIEISARGVRVPRRTKGPLGQTNHFYSGDQKSMAFFPNLNKKLESSTRMRVLENYFSENFSSSSKQQLWTAQNAIDQLANHEDEFGNFQSFGTTAVKAYGVMSTVMLPKKMQIWMTVGDFMPSAHSTYLGFSLDSDFRAIEAIGSRREQRLSGRPGVLGGLQRYVQARLAYEKGDLKQATQHLRRAIESSLEDGVDDPQYRYVMARLLAQQEMFQEADSEFGKIRGRQTDYQKALGILFRGINRQHWKANTGSYRSQIRWAKKVFEKALREHRHSETEQNIATIQKLLEDELVDLDDAIDWVVVR